MKNKPAMGRTVVMVMNSSLLALPMAQRVVHLVEGEAARLENREDYVRELGVELVKIQK